MGTYRSELRDLTLFSGVSRPAMAVISKQLTRLDLPVGSLLVREGEIGNEFLILGQGEAEVTQGGTTIATVGRNDLVGEMALLQEGGPGRRNATERATTDVVVYVGSRTEFQRMISAAPKVAERVRQTASFRNLAVAA